MTESSFDSEGLFNEDYLYFYAERTASARSVAEGELVWRLLELEPDMEVLDLACGHGRLANYLAERGCRVTGLDATPLFLERAREDAHARAVTVDYVLGDMRRLPWGRRFDRIINWFTSFGYFTDADNRLVLAECVRVLRPGGRLALDMMHYLWLLRHYQPVTMIERDGNLLIDQNQLEPLTGRNMVERVVIRGGQVRRIPFFVRLFTFTELRGTGCWRQALPR
ncbi:MAG: class I SAM-dependent methyltransferase [Pseudonocardiaceae bacterium]